LTRFAPGKLVYAFVFGDIWGEIIALGTKIMWQYPRVWGAVYGGN